MLLDPSMNPRMKVRVIAMIVVVMMMTGVQNLLGVEGKEVDMDMDMIMIMEMDVDMGRERERVKRGKEVRMLMKGNRIIRGRENDHYEWVGKGMETGKRKWHFIRVLV